jgi:hypothetical protein
MHAKIPRSGESERTWALPKGNDLFERGRERLPTKGVAWFWEIPWFCLRRQGAGITVWHWCMVPWPLPCPPKDSLPAYLGHDTENKNPKPLQRGQERRHTDFLFTKSALQKHWVARGVLASQHIKNQQAYIDINCGLLLQVATPREWSLHPHKKAPELNGH